MTKHDEGSAEIRTGMRVEMRSGESGYLGVPYPDLGEGTVVATTGEGLLDGLYVRVRWDEYHGTIAERPAIQSLRVVGGKA